MDSCLSFILKVGGSSFDFTETRVQKYTNYFKSIFVYVYNLYQ